MTMFGEFTLPIWTLFVFILGYMFGYAGGKPSGDDEDDSPGAVGADELDRGDP